MSSEEVARAAKIAKLEAEIAALVAFFPILSNTTLGLKSADFNLMELMRLYGASRWQILWRLQLPTALPYLLGACRIAGGLALIGAVVAEFVAGSGTATGLAVAASTSATVYLPAGSAIILTYSGGTVTWVWLAV